MTTERIFDADTHVGPTMDVLEAYLDPGVMAKLEPYESFKRVQPRQGHISYTMGARSYTRPLGQRSAEEAAAQEKSGEKPAEYMKGFTGAHRASPEREIERDPAARIRDMDREGVYVNLLLPSGWFGTWGGLDDLELETSMYRGYHRWMRDYCAAFPERLTGVILVSGRDVDEGLKQIAEFGQDRWAMGVFVYAPVGMPLDHPDLEPIWAAAQDWNLTVVLHTFTVMPPYSPGGLDTWDNLWLQRSAAHPWCGMRNMAAIIGAGILDRYSALRMAVLEAGHGWLPFWVKRLDEHVKTISGSLPNLQMLPSEYVTSGRYFQSTEISEGPEVTKALIDILGDGILMYGSDYPHGESAFPESVSMVMEWDLADDVRRKLLWDNAVKCYARYDVSAG